ncbi:MAG: sporulation protein YunB [Oscillospiraceae bacterium]|nr:sporulation protein YunB [Oscillospiraceae bacterium]
MQMGKLGRIKRKRHRVLGAVFVAAGILMILGCLLLGYYVRRIDPLVEQTALYTVTDAVSLKINRVIQSQIRSGLLDYDALVTMEKDAEGNVTALITNVSAVNLLQAEITTRIIQEISDNFVSELEIPLGTVMDSSLFYGRGPLIPVKLKAVTNVSARFENDFSAAGINQTRHQIRLNVSVQVLVVIPGRELTAPVNTTVVIAETVIVGKVPELYASMDEVR